MKYSKHFSTKTGPVSSPIVGRPEMVKNNDVGYVFTTSPENTVKRFLILGSCGGTFYVGERKLTVDNAKAIQKLASEGAEWLVPLITKVSVDGLAPKNDPAIFALAVCLAFGTNKVKAQAYSSIAQVCRIGTHIYQLTQCVQDMRGWSRGLRRGVASYYENKTVEQMAYDFMKYRQRDGWTPFDVIRLSHPKLSGEVKGMIEEFKGKEHSLFVPANWAAFKEVQTTDKWQRVVELVTQYKLPWETVPTEMHSRPEVWEALIPHMGLTALLRNLSRFSRLGVTTEAGLDANTKLICKKLMDHEVLKKSRLHPLTILNGAMAYAKGISDRSGEGWKPTPRIVGALEDAFYLSFDYVESTGKAQMLAIDISASMTHHNIAGMSLTPRQASAALALVTKSVEPESFIIGFSSVTKILDIRKGQRLEDVIKYIDSNTVATATNPSLVLRYAVDNKLKLDGMILYTDNEMNEGTHVAQELNAYRKIVGHDVKMAVVGMTATNFTVADPKDSSMMDIAGFGTDTPSIIAAFLKGEL